MAHGGGNMVSALDLEMTSDRDGITESGRKVPEGTRVNYAGHISGGAIRVIFEDGSEDVMSPLCFEQLR